MPYRRWNPGCPCCETEESICNQIYPYVAWHSGIPNEHHCFGLWIGSGNTFINSDTYLLTHYNEYIYRRPSISGISIELSLSETEILNHLNSARPHQKYRRIDSLTFTYGSGIISYEFNEIFNSGLSPVYKTLTLDTNLSTYNNCLPYMNRFLDNDLTDGGMVSLSGLYINTIFATRLVSYDEVSYDNSPNIRYEYFTSGFGTCVNLASGTMLSRTESPVNKPILYDFDGYWIPGFWTNNIALYGGYWRTTSPHTNAAVFYFTPAATHRWGDYPSLNPFDGSVILYRHSPSYNLLFDSYDDRPTIIDLPNYFDIKNTHRESGVLAKLQLSTLTAPFKHVNFAITGQTFRLNNTSDITASDFDVGPEPYYYSVASNICANIGILDVIRQV